MWHIDGGSLIQMIPLLEGTYIYIYIYIDCIGLFSSLRILNERAYDSKFQTLDLRHCFTVQKST